MSRLAVRETRHGLVIKQPQPSALPSLASLVGAAPPRQPPGAGAGAGAGAWGWARLWAIIRL